MGTTTAAEYSSPRRSHQFKGLSFPTIVPILILVSVFNIVECYSSQSDSSSLIMGVLKRLEREAAPLSRSTKCATDVASVVKGFAEERLWALRIADSSGKVSPNFIFGANFWLGSQTACESINQQTTLDISQEIHSVHGILSEVSEVQVAYRLFVVNFTSARQIDVQFNIRPLLHVGLCLPQACEATDFYRPLEAAIGEGSETNQLLKIENVKVLYHKVGLEERWSLFRIKEFYILATTIGLSLAISLVCRATFRATDKEILSKDCEGNSPSRKEVETIQKNLVECFSLKDNWNQLFQTASSAKEILAINGIRTFACFWIIVLHTNIYARFAVTSIPEVQHLMTNSGVFMRILTYGFVSVDSFFAVSGFLLVFNFLRNAALRRRIQDGPCHQSLVVYLKCIAHRYIRLTPLLIVVMVAIRLSNAYLDRASYFDVRINVPDLECSTDMLLLNLVYGQNWINGFLICGSWLWYLANDMQYYIIFLCLLFVYVKHPLFAKIIFAFSVICTLGITFAVCYLNGFTLQADVIYRLYEKTYTVPYIRVIPFQAGMLMGFVADYHRKAPIKVKPRWTNLGWILFLGYLLAPIVASSDVKNISSLICSIMYSGGKFLYGICVGGVILLCLIASESPINRILSQTFFVHLNKLCYGMFLIHPVVVLLLFGLRSQAASLSASLVLTYSLAVIAISYVVAVGMSVFIELPFIKLSNLKKLR